MSTKMGTKTVADSIRKYRAGMIDDLFAERDELRRRIANMRAWLGKWYAICIVHSLGHHVEVPGSEILAARRGDPPPRRAAGKRR